MSTQIEKIAHILTMPADILVRHIMPRCSPKVCNVLTRVCKPWSEIVTPKLGEAVLNYITFDKPKWLTIPGVIDVSDMPVLSPETVEKLIAKIKKPCPFFNAPDPLQPHRFEDGKKKTWRVWETHVVLLYPEKINGEPRTVTRQGKLFSFLRKGEHESVYEYIIGDPKDDFRNQNAPPSYVGLVTLDGVPDSRGKIYSEKEKLVTDQGYRLFKTANEAITSIAIMNLGPSQKQEGYFFGREGDWFTYAITQEKSPHDLYYVVGAAAPSGLRADDRYYAINSVVAAGVAEVL